MIWTVPIEPLSGRYSSDWNRWFDLEWGNSTRWIFGESVSREIKTGDFLDVHNTHRYKASQVVEIARLLQQGQIKENDVLFFHDLWFPLEQVFYMLDAVGLDVKVAGYLHCGSYSRHDLLHRSGMNDWAADVERGWFKRLDLIMVFSQHHAQQLQQHRGVPDYKIKVVPFPYKLDEIKQYSSDRKTIKVVWPHRPGPDKITREGKWLLDKLKQDNIQVFSTWEECDSKADYFRALGRAEFALCWPPSETFGIAAMEAGFLGAMPIVPNRLSYRFLYDRRFDTAQNAHKFISNEEPEAVSGPWMTAESGFRVAKEHLGDLVDFGGPR